MTLEQVLDRFVAEVRACGRSIDDPVTIAMLADAYEEHGRPVMADYVRHLRMFEELRWADDGPISFYRKANLSWKTWWEEGESCVPILSLELDKAHKRVFPR